MASHGALGEVVMATEAYKRLPSPTPKLSALVGGLGAGHTLRAVLDLPDLAAVTVAEIGPKVVEWNRLYFAETNGHAIADPRVNLQIADVMEVLRAANASYHLILLDVDNGPGWLASAGNAHLYTQGRAGRLPSRSGTPRHIGDLEPQPQSTPGRSPTGYLSRG